MAVGQRLLRHRFGPRSEQLDLDQLQLGLEDAEQGAAEDTAAKGAAETSERRWRSSRPTAIADAGTSATPRGCHRCREQGMSLLWGRTAHDR